MSDQNNVPSHPIVPVTTHTEDIIDGQGSGGITWSGWFTPSTNDAQGIYEATDQAIQHALDEMRADLITNPSTPNKEQTFTATVYPATLVPDEWTEGEVQDYVDRIDDIGLKPVFSITRRVPDPSKVMPTF